MNNIERHIKPLFEQRKREVERHLETVGDASLLQRGVDAIVSNIEKRFKVIAPELNRDEVKHIVKTEQLRGNQLSPKVSAYTVERTYQTEVHTFQVPLSTSTFEKEHVLPERLGSVGITYYTGKVQFQSMYCEELHSGMDSDSPIQTAKSVCDQLENWLEVVAKEAERFNQRIVQDARRELTARHDQAQSDQEKGGTISL